MATSALPSTSPGHAATPLVEVERPERHLVEDGRLVRRIARRDGSETTTDLGAAGWRLRDPHGEADRRFLRRRSAPDWNSSDESAIRVIDLFSGCGALSLGALEAARALGLPARVELAVDLEQAPLDVLSASLGAGESVRRCDLATALDGEIGQPETDAERLLLKGVGPDPEICVAGPPCQGHSSLNNHTRHDDQRNDLYLRTVRFVELRQPRLVVIENVASILSDQRRSVERAEELLEDLNYGVDHDMVCLDELGVPQTRRRHLLLAVARGTSPISVSGLVNAYRVQDLKRRNLRWAIGDLAGLDGESEIDRPAVPSKTNEDRMRLLIDRDLEDLPDEHRPPCHQQGGHTYKSMYGRLNWDRPAQTVTSGFGSMGQGRYVHPDEPRTLTAHEAARLQLLPDFMRLDLATGRQQRARMIGNVAPMKLSYSAVLELLR